MGWASRIYGGEKHDTGHIRQKTVTQHRQPIEVLLPVAHAQPAPGHSDVQTLLMLLDQRDKRIEELAERVGRYAERVEHLEQEVERLRQSTPQPVEPKRVPWWRKWFGPI